MSGTLLACKLGRMSILLFRAPGLIAALAVSLAAVAPVRAQGWDEAAHLREIQNIVRAVESASREKTEPPRLSGAGGDGFRRALNASRVRPANVGQAGAAIDVCFSSQQMNMAYLLYGTGLTPELFPKANATQLAVIGSNVVRYQDEAHLARAFEVRCTAAVAPEMSKFFLGLPQSERTPTRLAGLGSMQLGLRQTLEGALVSISQDEARKENRAIVAAAVRDSLPNLLAFLSRSERETLLAAVDRMRPGVQPDVKGLFDTVSTNLRTADCTDLCAVTSG